MTQDIIEMAKHIANTFGTRMCDEHGETYGEELYAMGIDDIVEAIKLVAQREQKQDWSLLEATQESLREHMAMLKELQAKQEQAAPVAWMKEGWGPDCGPYIEFYRDDEMGWRDRKEWTPLYTTPQPQREWIGLTDDDVDYIADEYSSLQGAIRAIEAKLKEKNT